MSLFHVISVAVPLTFLLVLPRVLKKYTQNEKQYRLLLYVACALFFISWYLPSPLIDGQDTSFVTHFVGGGMFTGFLWLYVRYSLQLKLRWFMDAAILFALVSALGSINELFELFLVQAHLARILITDTSWDILANTLGALLVFILHSIFSILNSNPHDRRH
jgi:hypothetical protein